jgi:hypothetical protein
MEGKLKVNRRPSSSSLPLIQSTSIQTRAMRVQTTNDDVISSQPQETGRKRKIKGIMIDKETSSVEPIIQTLLSGRKRRKIIIE